MEPTNGLINFSYPRASDENPVLFFIYITFIMTYAYAIMNRTTIVLPDPLKGKLMQLAQKEQVSFGELVRRALEKYLLPRTSEAFEDSLFQSQTVFHDAGPQDVALHHDQALTSMSVHGNTIRKKK